MRSRWTAGLLLGLALICVLAATAPARLLTRFLPQGQLELQGLEGTLWHGGASRATVSTPAGMLQLGRVEWRLSPFSLLLFSPAITLDSSWGVQQFQGELRLRGSADLDLRDLDGRFDAALVGHFLPVRLGGMISLQFADLELRDGLPHRADGRLVWQDAGWQSPEGMRPLGSYAVDLSSAGDDVIAGNVVTLAGQLSAEGGLRLQGDAYDVDILLSGRGLDDPQLRQALQLMAAPEGEGFRLQLQGQLQR